MPEFDILLSEVKNERKEGLKGVVTLGEVAVDLGFGNRCAVSDEAAAELVDGELRDIIRERCNRVFPLYNQISKKENL